MLRIALFLATCLSVFVMLTLVGTVTGALRWFANVGGSTYQLLIGLFFFSVAGSAVSALLCRPMAKWAVGAQLIGGTEGLNEAWLMETIRNLADQANVPMPQVAIFEGPPNVVTTGCSTQQTLIAVSTGLMRALDRRQLEAVLAHEISHIVEGDVVTMVLIQGVLNTFIFGPARLFSIVFDLRLRKMTRSSRSPGYAASVYVFWFVTGGIASAVAARYSRWREFTADAAAAKLLGDTEALVSALEALGQVTTRKLPEALSFFGIVGQHSGAYASHPQLEQRILALRKNADRARITPACPIPTEQTAPTQ